MSQTETTGSPMTLAGELPEKGQRFPDLELATTFGHSLRISDYRGRSNLVLLFTDDQAATKQLLSEVATFYEQFKGQEAEIIAVAQLSKDECDKLGEQLKLPFPLLSDEDGHLHREIGASNQSGHVSAAAYVTDRYAEVFAVYRTRDGQLLPEIAEIINWLQFINIQCPECEPPEWPA
jgi:peroxiredoxin